MPRGGKREGAGRKPIRDEFRSQAAAVTDIFAGGASEAATALITLAKSGDRAAAEYVVNRLMGKPVEQIDQHNSGELTVSFVNDWRERKDK